MIYVTGDTHRSIDVNKLNTKNFPQQKEMTKHNAVIICGDFGCVWDGSGEDIYWRKWHSKKPYTTLFVDGNHENHKLLAEFPVGEQFGGSVHRIAPRLFHMMRGEVFDIGGAKVFCMGGAASHDKQYRKKDVSWWEEEIPSAAEFDHAIAILEKHDWCVDYIVTHCAPNRIQRKIADWFQTDQLTSFLQLVEENCKFEHWYFGHYHIDRGIDEKHTALYQKVIPLGSSI